MGVVALNSQCRNGTVAQCLRKALNMSKYQDDELMSALSAQIAVISVGAKNSYGHPAPETIASLTRLGTQVVRTDIDGAVAITAKAHHLRVRKSKGTIKLFYWS